MMATHRLSLARIYLYQLLVAVAVVAAVAVFAVVATVGRAVAQVLSLVARLVQVSQAKVTRAVRSMTQVVAVQQLVAVAVKALSGRRVSLLAETFSVATVVVAHYMTAFTMQAVAVHQCKTQHKALPTAKAAKAVAVTVASTHQTQCQRQAQRTQAVAEAVA